MSIWQKAPGLTTESCSHLKSRNHTYLELLAARAIAARRLREYNKIAVGASRSRCHGAGSSSYAAPLFCFIRNRFPYSPSGDMRNRPLGGLVSPPSNKNPKVSDAANIIATPRAQPMSPIHTGRGQSTGASLPEAEALRTSTLLCHQKRNTASRSLVNVDLVKRLCQVLSPAT